MNVELNARTVRLKFFMHLGSEVLQSLVAQTDPCFLENFMSDHLDNFRKPNYCYYILSNTELYAGSYTQINSTNLCSVSDYYSSDIYAPLSFLTFRKLMQFQLKHLILTHLEYFKCSGSSFFLEAIWYILKSASIFSCGVLFHITYTSENPTMRNRRELGRGC